MSGKQWFALRWDGRNAGGQFTTVLAYSQDIEKLKAYASTEINKLLEWTDTNRAKVTEWTSFAIDPDDKVIILL